MSFGNCESLPLNLCPPVLPDLQSPKARRVAQKPLLTAMNAEAAGKLTTFELLNAQRTCPDRGWSVEPTARAVARTMEKMMMLPPSV